MDAYSSLIRQPDGDAVEFSERLSRKVLASLKSLNESLTEVRASVAKIDSIAHARLTATSPGSKAVPTSFASPPASADKQLLTPSARSFAALAASPSGEPEAQVPSAPLGSAASPNNSALPISGTAQSVAAEIELSSSSIVRPATSAIGTEPPRVDVSILERILLAPALKGVGLGEDILQLAKASLPATTMVTIEQHMRKSHPGTEAAQPSSSLADPASSVPSQTKVALKQSIAVTGSQGKRTGPTRYYSFPRYNPVHGSFSPSDEAADDGHGAIPFLREMLTEEAFQQVLAKDSAKGAHHGGQVSQGGESASLPAGADSFTILDDSPLPAVQDWQGGDIEWQTADNSTLAALETASGKLTGGNRRRVEAFALRVVYEAGRTGFEEAKEIAAEPGDILAGRYKVNSFLGSAAFSSALSCTDLVNNEDVALKIIKNDKDFLDQSLDEIKLLRYLNAQGDSDAHRVLKLKDYFYHREHLFIVTELLKDNLYDWQTYVSENQPEPYFTLPRVQRIARQVLQALAFVHGNGLIHCDLKPENILILSYSRCDIKVIDFGSSCYLTDKLSTYIQSRSYRAPEVVLGLPYGPKIDVWSLGCILTELLTGKVLFPNESVQTMLVRMQSLLGPFPAAMVTQGKDSSKYLTPAGTVYEAQDETEVEGEAMSIMRPVATTLAVRSGSDDPQWLDFIAALLSVDPALRPTAAQALQHPWLASELPFEPYKMQ